METISIHLIGCGAISKLFYTPVLKELSASKRITVKSLVDPNPESLKNISDVFPKATCYSSVEEVKMERGEIGIVASPVKFHAEQSIFLLKNGISVLCEKPMAQSSSEASKMIQASGENQSLLAVGLMRRFFPVLSQLRTIIDSGEFGKLRLIQLKEGNVFNWPAATASFFDPQKTIGGVLLDVGVHVIDTLIYLLGEPDQVKYADDNRNGVESNAILDFEYHQGPKGQIRLSWDTNLKSEYIFEFERAILTLEPGNPKFLKIKSTKSNLDIEGSLCSANGEVTSYHEAIGAQVLDFIESVELNRSPKVTGEEGIRSLKLIERCYSTRNLIHEEWNVPADWISSIIQ